MMGIASVVAVAHGLSLPTRRDCLARSLAVAPASLAAVVAQAATEAELKSMLSATQEEIEKPKPKKASKAPEPARSSSDGIKLPSIGNISEQLAAEGRARADARRSSFATKPAPKPTETSEGAGVYSELRAKRQAKKEAAAEKIAAKKKNLTPIEEFKSGRQ